MGACVDVVVHLPEATCLMSEARQAFQWRSRVLGQAGSGRRAAAGSLLTALIAQLALLVTGIISARSLGVHDRGYLATLVLVPVVLTLVGTFGLPAAIPYFLARRPLDRSRVIRAVLPVAVTQLLVLTAAHVILGWTLLAPHTVPERTALYLSFLFVPGMLTNEYGLALLQGDRNFKMFNLIRVAPSIATALVAVLLLLMGAAALVNLTGSLALLTLLGGLWALAAARPRWPGTTLGGPTLRDLSSFGLRAFLGSASPSETFRLDQIVVAGFLSTTALGLYVTASAFTNLIRLVAQSVGMVAYPMVASTPDPARRQRLVWYYGGAVGLVTGALIVVLVPAMPWLLPLLFGEAFVPAVVPAQILVIGSLFLGVRRVLGDALRGYGLPGPASVAEVVSWISLLTLMPLFASQAGIQGVALSLAVSWAVSLVALILTQHILMGRIRAAEQPDEGSGTAVRIWTRWS